MWIVLRPIHCHFICLFINYDKSVERGNLYIKVIDISISHDPSFNLFKHNGTRRNYMLNTCKTAFFGSSRLLTS